jgi:6-pyruvoyltetrahydropterin/6-carboxytetrahydropterin synthase
MSTEITRRLYFDAGHRVALAESKCCNPHGHRYMVDVTVSAKVLTAEGFVVDFGKVKALLGGWIDENLDHTTIVGRGDEFMMLVAKGWEGHYLLPLAGDAKKFFVMDEAPTAENLAFLLYEKAVELLTGCGIDVDCVDVWETPNCRARFPA